MNAPVSQRPVVTAYINVQYEELCDVYIVFRSGVVMVCPDVDGYLRALNSPNYEWSPSVYGETHVRDIFEFIGYFPAPCQEQI